jgi:M6 family metalloprotease-like protein
MRGEHRIGCRTQSLSYGSESLLDCEEGFTIAQFARREVGTTFTRIPNTATKFVVPEGSAPIRGGGIVDVVILVTAFVWPVELTDDDPPVRVRAVVDGLIAAPGDIVWADADAGQEFHAQSFLFTQRIGAGIHTVELEWTAEGSAARIRDASVLVLADIPPETGHVLAARSSPGNAPVAMDSGAWEAVPLALLELETAEDGPVTLWFSAALEQTAGDFVMLRAIVDDGAVAVEPPEIALAARMDDPEARAAAFIVPELPAGDHTVRFEWRGSITDEVAQATARGWSAAAIVGPPDDAALPVGLHVASQTGPPFTAQPEDGWEAIPGLEVSLDLDEGFTEAALIFSGGVTGRDPAWVAPRINGVTQADQATVLHHPVLFCPADDPLCSPPIVHDAGARSYAFKLPARPPSDDPTTIGLAVRSSEFDDSYSTVHDATLTLLRQPWLGPDLGHGANFGAASSQRHAPVEPARGERPLLLIVIDPERVKQPVADLDFMNEVEALAFGDHPAADGYFDAMSGGRLNLVPAGAGVLGPYGTLEDADHYWSEHDCEDEDAVDDGYRSGFAELQAEALAAADAEFDFAAWDRNEDGAVTSDELAVVIVVPQSSGSGSNAVSSFKPLCGEDPWFVAGDGPDGTIVRQLLHWYTPGFGEDATATATDEVALKSLATLVHELGHLLFWLDDHYFATERFVAGPNIGQVCDAGGADEGDINCQTRIVPTVPERISLMASTNASTNHLDGVHKIHLGWVTPEWVGATGAYTLADVKVDPRALILPRRNSAHLEYFVLEARFEAPVPDDPAYDYELLDEGLAIYHVIEPEGGCMTGIWPPSNCDSYIPAPCVTPTVWDAFFSNFLRPGLRLIQPDYMHHTSCAEDEGDIDCSTEKNQTLWGTGAVGGQSISDEGPSGCPVWFGDPLPDDVAPLLQWADGSPSGYGLEAITLMGSDTLALTVTVEVGGP